MRHSERVAEAVQRWRDELAALGGRDPLLSFRDLKVGTLDLAAAEPEARRRLLESEPVPLSKLFPHEPLRSSALRSTRAIRDKSRELFEDRGLVTSLLAVGISTWSNPFAAHRPTAPVLLRTASVVARDPAETDFLITVADDPVVNPVLLHALDTQVGLRFQADDLRDHSGQLKYTTVVERLRELAPAHVVDGFSIAHRAVLATFSTVPLLLARDIEDLGAELEQHDIIAALAGDDDARATIGAAEPSVAPTYLAVDTDADQREVISTVAGGGNLLVDAPPGSGRTQTVAGIAAELVGRGRRVLVVSQKRTTAADLVDRLTSVGLDDVVLDVGGMSAGDAVRRVTEAAQRLRESAAGLGAAGAAGAAGAGAAGVGERADAEKLERLRAELDTYRDAVHRVREPWGCSAYDAMVAMATTPEECRTSVRISPEALERGRSVSGLRAQLREYAELEGLTLTKEGSPWYGSDVTTPEVADSLRTTVIGLRDTYVPELRDAATRAAVEVGLTGPNSLTECVQVVELLSSVSDTVHNVGPDLWTEPIDDLIAATAPRAQRDRGDNKLGFFTRRRLRRRAYELAAISGKRRERETVHDRLVAAGRLLAAWKERARDGKLPRVGTHLPRAVEAVTAVQRRLSVLEEANPRARNIAEQSFAEAGRRLNALVLDERHLRALPRLTTLQAELTAAGLDPLIDDLRRREVGPERVEQILEYAQLASLLSHWRETDSALRGFNEAEHARTVDEFRAADQAEVREAARRVRSARDQRFAEVCEGFEGQADVLVGSAGASGPDGARSTKELLGMAPDVALSAVPCWVMSPLHVAGALPARRLFDVVIFEDAARVAVTEAVPAISRGSRVVLIADDEVAMTSFTTAVEPAPDPDEQEGPWAGDPPESVADALGGLLPVCRLRGQFRVRDDRLVAYAARTSYAGRMTPVPAAGGNERLTLELVDAPTSGDDPVDSSSAEVQRVVELVLEHLRARPHESLGVVTLGPRHAERLEAALRRALVRAPDVAEYLREDRTESFFVKDVERVAGDVRDAIILSLGYGRSVDGRILYRFGALGRPGGERRLASATTRARERLVVVSTFGADDLSPRRLTTPGAWALRDFLAYVQAGGRPTYQERAPGADALAEVVAERLRAAGATVDVGHGGAAGVAVAVRHPTRRDRFVLAVETDSPSGPASGPARERERIRPMLLNRLGWNVWRLWAESWATDPDGAAKRLVRAYEDAVSEADAYDWAVAAAEADAAPTDAAPTDAAPTDAAPTDAAPTDAVLAVDAPAGDVSDSASDDEPAVARHGSRPALTAGWTVRDYTSRELAAMARWVQSDGVSRSEDDVADLIAVELKLPLDDARTRDVLRHAVRVARATAA